MTPSGTRPAVDRVQTCAFDNGLVPPSGCAIRLGTLREARQLIVLELLSVR
jgi:hypothetical protein